MGFLTDIHFTSSNPHRANHYKDILELGPGQSQGKASTPYN